MKSKKPKPTTPRKQGPKVPKAKVMYQDIDKAIYEHPISAGGGYPASTPVSVIPGTLAQARLRVKVANMNHEERESEAAKAEQLKECARSSQIDPVFVRMLELNRDA